MTTPRPYLWQSLQLRASEADGVGGIAHYFDEEAQSLYLHDGICSKELYVESGHWEDLTAGSEVDFDTEEYSQMSWTHPATGSLYGTVIKDDETDTVYLLRYTYAKDIGKFVSSSSWRAQIDNPINQFSASIKNWDSEAIIKSASLFCPGARVQVGLTMGDSNICQLGTVHLDEVNFEYNAKSVSISGRNKTGFLLNDQTFNASGTKTDTVDNVCKWVLDYFGVTGYIIQETEETISIDYEASDTGLKTLQSICDKVSGYTDGTDWDIEERFDGLIVIGFNAFRASYNPKSVFKFNGRNELIKRSSRKNIDGAYSKVYCTGRDSNNNDLTPVIADVTTWAHWDVVARKTYFAPTLEGVTQAELARYAQVLVKQLKRTGLNEGYNTTIKPQLLVGDYATVQEGETETDIGIITQVTHSMGENGFFTDFVADSGGDKKTLLSRAVGSSEQVYTSTRRNNGDNRQKRLMDYIKGTTKEVIRSSGGIAPSGGGGNVDDVKVNDVSVVQNKIAKITSYKEVTQQEYDNLPASKTSDGVAYFIKDASGGGGASALADLDDVSISSQTNGQVLKYNSTSQKWENANESSGSGHNYSTTEQVVGTWIDGKTIYEKIIDNGIDMEISNSSWQTTGITINNGKMIISCFGISNDNSFQGAIMGYVDNNILFCQTGRNSSSAWVRYFIIQYTKTTAQGE